MYDLKRTTTNQSKYQLSQQTKTMNSLDTVYKTEHRLIAQAQFQEYTITLLLKLYIDITC